MSNQYLGKLSFTDDQVMKTQELKFFGYMMKKLQEKYTKSGCGISEKDRR